MSTPTNEKSGKTLIFGVILLGLAGAAAGWWFRYSMTHQAVTFWGPQGAMLIRDAPIATLRSDTASQDAEGTDEADVPRNISQAPGLMHLRTALLEDTSYDWQTTAAPNTDWSQSLVFEESAGAEPRLVILFSDDFKWAANGSSGDPTKNAVATSAKFASGLQEFFSERAAAAPAEE